MNSKAKQRAWSHASESDEVELEGAPAQAAPLAPLVAPEGQQVFDVGEENVGERLDRFLGQAAAARRIALSRTRLKGLIEAGSVLLNGASTKPARKLRHGETELPLVTIRSVGYRLADET